MEWVYIGLIAGALTSLGFLPQIIKGFKTKRMKDVSMIMSILILAGMLLWLSYGIYLKDIPVIVANITGSCCLIMIIVLKARYSK